MVMLRNKLLFGNEWFKIVVKIFGMLLKMRNGS